ARPCCRNQALISSTSSSVVSVSLAGHGGTGGAPLAAASSRATVHRRQPLTCSITSRTVHSPSIGSSPVIGPPCSARSTTARHQTRSVSIDRITSIFVTGGSFIVVYSIAAGHSIQGLEARV